MPELAESLCQALITGKRCEYLTNEGTWIQIYMVEMRMDLTHLKVIPVSAKDGLAMQPFAVSIDRLRLLPEV